MLLTDKPVENLICSPCYISFHFTSKDVNNTPMFLDNYETISKNHNFKIKKICSCIR